MSPVTRVGPFAALVLALSVSIASAQSWTTTTPLTTARDHAVAHAIGQDIYLVGGRDLATLEVLDTRTDTWSPRASMLVDRALFASGVIGGKIYVAGGMSTGAIALSSGEVYDLGSNSWSSIAPLPVTLSCMASAVSHSKLYVFSGAELSGAIDEPRPYVFVYDPATNLWTRLNDMPRPRKVGAAVELGGKIYVVGGQTQGYGVGGSQRWVDIYDPATDTWTIAPDLPVPFGLHSVVTCHGRIWTMGGLDIWPNILPYVFSFRPGASGWREELPLPAPLFIMGAATNDRATIYTFGGGQDEAHDFAATDVVYKRAVNEPDIVSITDVPNDQGGKVSIRWIASVLDVAPGNPIDAYWIWRQVPTGLALQALAGRVQPAGASGLLSANDGRVFKTTLDGSQLYYWEYVGSQVAHGFPAYSYTAPTLFDATPDSDPYTLFMVEAEQLEEGIYWSSAPDSGHSIDNLAPPSPLLIAATYLDGTASLRWEPSVAPDLARYNVYRGNDQSFSPGPVNLVGSTSDTSFVTYAGAPYYYKLSALDIHGNESSFVTVLPTGTLGVEDGLARGLALAAPRPNPAPGNADIRFALSREGPATLEVFDASGRCVRVLASGVMSAGEHSIRFDLADGSGLRSSAGLYFVRLSAEGRQLTRRLVVIR